MGYTNGMCTKMSNKNERIYTINWRIVKYICIIFLFISTLTFGQLYEYEGGYVVKLNETATEFKADSIFSSCGTFLLQDGNTPNFAVNIRHYVNNSLKNIYIIDEKEIDVKHNHMTYYKGFEIANSDNKVVINFDIKNSTINIGKFINEDFFIFVYILKPINHDH